VVDWTVTDAASGPGPVTATLDGAPIAKGTTLVLPQLALGTHTLVVRSADVAGNPVERTVVFTVGTSVTDLQAMLDRFQAEGKVGWAAGFVLEAQLDQARRELARGRTDRAIFWLTEFSAFAKYAVKDATARTVLRTDATAVIAALRG
jgi:hypothetical protein